MLYNYVKMKYMFQNILNLRSDCGVRILLILRGILKFLRTDTFTI